MKMSREDLLYEIAKIVGCPRHEKHDRKFSKRELFHIHSFLEQTVALNRELREAARELERVRRVNR